MNARGRSFLIAALVLLALAAVVIFSRQHIEEVRYEGEFKAWDDLMAGAIQYGFVGNEVKFVVFEAGKNTIVPHAKIVTTGGGHVVGTAEIELPDGSHHDLTGSRQIYEFNSGEFSSAPIDFNLEQLKGYLATKPHPPTIKGLKASLH